jgi:uncharacterized coiled-coil protein SlyX
MWIIRGFLLIPLAVALACFALSPTARAVDPPPDGGYFNFNTAEGEDALFSLTAGGISNTAIGFHALYSSTIGSENTANGAYALEFNTIGRYNTATGFIALNRNTTGDWNTANGFQALWNNTTGFYNTANGVNTLASNTTGHNNTADGRNALQRNTTGSSNTALGPGAGRNLTTGDNNIDIGNPGAADESNTVRIGEQAAQTATFIAGISGATVTGRAVVVNNIGQLGVAPSSARFKDGIKPIDKASEAILALQPVTFRYKHELDPNGIPQFGLVAEQVEKVNPDLVARDDQGKAYTVRYEAVNAMLLNEFLKEHRKVQEQEHAIAVQDRKAQEQDATMAELKSAIAEQQVEIKALTASLKEQASQIQKVTRLRRVEVNNTAPQLVADNQ